MDVNKPTADQPAAAAVKEEPVPFDPSRMIGIIKRKALIKDLAAAYHAECLAYCQELLQLQRKWEEQQQQQQFAEKKNLEEARKRRPSKRPKKGI